MKQVTNVVTEEKPSQLNSLISGVLVAYAITAVVLIGYAVLITYSSFTGQSLPLVVTVTTLISVVVAGFDASKYAESRGWLWGIIAGLIYAVLLAAIGIWVNKGFKVDSRTITLLILSLSGGGLGGVIGINMGILKKPKR